MQPVWWPPFHDPSSYELYRSNDRAGDAGGYLPIDKTEGPQAQYSYYQQTYQQAQQSLDSNTGLKGIMFWRWAGVDPTAQLASTDFNEAATIGEACPYTRCMPTGFQELSGQSLLRCASRLQGTTRWR